LTELGKGSRTDRVGRPSALILWPSDTILNAADYNLKSCGVNYIHAIL